MVRANFEPTDRDHKFMLWDRMINGLYDLLDGIIIANYPSKKRGFRNYYANVQNEHFVVVAQHHQYVGHTKILISCATTIAYLTREEPNLSIDSSDNFFSSRR